MLVSAPFVYFPLYFGILFGYWRCFNFIMVFGPNIRTNVIMYQSTIVNLVPFLTILMLFQLSFTVSRIVLKKDEIQRADSTEKSE